MTDVRRARTRQSASTLAALAFATVGACADGAPSEPESREMPLRAVALSIDNFGRIGGATLTRTQPIPYSIVAFDARGDTVPVPQPVTLMSRDERVLTFDAGGRMWLHAPGGTWIVVRAGSGARALVDSVEFRVICTADLRPVLAPREATLRVGEQLAPPTLRILLCQGQIEDTDDVSWRAREPEILEVNPATGAARAIRPGTTALIATGRKYAFLAAVDVVVVP